MSVWGLHTLEAYSSWGRTTVLYAVALRSSWWIFMLRFRKPRVWLAFLEILEMCIFQERFSEISTPRYFAAGTASKRTPCK